MRLFPGILRTFRSSHRRYSKKKLFLKISQNSQENAYVRVSFLIKLPAQGDLTNVKQHINGTLLFLKLLLRFSSAGFLFEIEDNQNNSK